MRHPLSYFISIPIAAILLLGAYAGAAGFYAIPVLAFLVMPIADALAGKSRWPSEFALKKMSKSKERGFEAGLIAAAVATLAVLGWALWAVESWRLSPYEFAGLVLSVGIFTGFVGIVVAHELMHRQTPLHRALGWVLMSAALYPHFCVEHVLGHHGRFATPEDPATARRGESLYSFLPRSIFGGLASAMRLRPLQVIAAWACVGLALVAVYRWLGPDALLFMVLQALVAVVLLEGINYLEHYGLERLPLSGGQYAAPGVAHSWDSSNILTNVNLFNLARHSDHHGFSRRPYYRLRHNDDAPQLPYGYATMFLAALVPPLWFRMMNPRIDARLARDARRDAPIAS